MLEILVSGDGDFCISMAEKMASRGGFLKRTFNIVKFSSSIRSLWSRSTITVPFIVQIEL